ncbi:hypothetical protein QBC41DRAFT_271817 [Cercophora samala]|uniref:Uncharacterized protein n=1 Tax=Cercophora samala TaxID=330535 RepID=A0AA40DEM6_9PEZI|nr:hypothetical protein QBC41DRAFT_271817 [Cercophora samala]
MASHIRQRDAEPTNSLTPGAIAGIACGSGAIFIGAAGLFILYWRRNRQYDREDDLYRTDSEEDVSRGAAIPAVSYTLDYKMNNPQQRHQHREDSGSYSYSPEKAAYPFSPLSTNSSSGPGSAMPTHPAYIPRAMVRGMPVSNHSSPQLTPPFNPPQNQQEQLPSFTFPQDNPSQHPPLARTTQRPSPLNLNTFSPSPSTSPSIPSSSTTQPTRKQPPRLPLLPLLSTTNSNPLPGKQNSTISGPLAFPSHYQPPPNLPPPKQHQHQQQQQKPKKVRNPHDQIYDDDSSSSGEEITGKEVEGYEESDIQYYHQQHHHHHHHQDSKRTFRERSLSGSGQGTQSQPNSGGLPPPQDHHHHHHRGKRSRRKRFSAGGGQEQHQQQQQQQQQQQTRGNRHYAEVEIGRGSDIW